MSQKKKLHIPEFFSKLKFGILSGPVKPSERIKELCFIEATITVTNASLSSSVSAGVCISFCSLRQELLLPSRPTSDPPPHPLFQITPVLNTGLSLSEPLQLYKGYNAK